jgi:hypothetical protein
LRAFKLQQPSRRSYSGCLFVTSRATRRCTRKSQKFLTNSLRAWLRVASSRGCSPDIRKADGPPMRPAMKTKSFLRSYAAGKALRSGEPLSTSLFTVENRRKIGRDVTSANVEEDVGIVTLRFELCNSWRLGCSRTSTTCTISATRLEGY